MDIRVFSKSARRKALTLASSVALVLVFLAASPALGLAERSEARSALEDTPPLPGSAFNDRFATRSGIQVEHLSEIQISNLATLAKVWGFLKYYKGLSTSEPGGWDYELFQVMPEILKAKSREAANGALVKWIQRLPQPAPCGPCVSLRIDDLQTHPPVNWITDRKLLGHDLSELLRSIYVNRQKDNPSSVELAPAGNPVFTGELPFASANFPDPGYQLLALFRFWNIVEYWYPYRALTDASWDSVLSTFIPRLAEAQTRGDYELQLMALIASIHDSHANLWSSLASRPPIGGCFLPIRIRYVENEPIVSGFVNGYAPSSLDFKVGDIVAELDGSAVSTLFERWAPYYGASSQAALRRDIGNYMTRGKCGQSTVGIVRNGVRALVNSTRVPIQRGDLSPGIHDLPGPTFQLLSPDVAYLKLSSVRADSEESYIDRAAGTKGLIIDIRNYPNQFVALSLGSMLVSQKTPFARFSVGDVSTPGAFHWTPPASLIPSNKHYKGKVVVLVDENTQSQAEYTAMAFKSVPGAIVVGSATAGSDGNVSKIPLPGGLFTLISGIGVFYPDKVPTQTIGVVPDVVVKPTLSDIIDRRDPVIEQAIKLIVGSKITDSEVRRTYQSKPTGD